MSESTELTIIITATDKASQTLKQTRNTADSLGRVMSGVLKIGAAGAAIAVGALGAELGKLMGRAFAAQGANAVFAKEMAAGFTDVEAILKKFGDVTDELLPQATGLAKDLAIVLGIDTPKAAKLLADALADPREAFKLLADAGVKLTDEEKRAIEVMVLTGNTAAAQKFILDKLTGSIGGTADAFGKTLPGSIQKTEEQLQSMMDGILKGAQPGLVAFSDKVRAALFEDIFTPANVESFTTGLNALFNIAATPEGWRFLGGAIFEEFKAGILQAVGAESPGLWRTIVLHWLDWIGIWTGNEAFLSKLRDSVNLIARTWVDVFFGEGTAKRFNDNLVSMIAGSINALGLGAAAAGILRGLGFGKGTVPGYAAGGTVPGPVGAPMLAMVHGGETITPAGGGQGGGGLTFVYSPAVSFASAAEMRAAYTMLDQWYQDARRRRY